jgi:hypothetical protein
MEVGVNTMRSSIILLLSLLAVLIFAPAILADTIKLKDGSVLKGKVVSYTQRKFTIIVYIGGTPSRHVVSVDEIESVEFDPGDVSSVARGGSPETATPRLDPVPAVSDPPPAARVEKEPVSTSSAKDPPPADVDAGAGAGTVVGERTITVAAAADWTSTEIRVQRGQRIFISASGEVELGQNHRSGPEGLSLADNRKLIPNRPTGALIAVVGDDNDDFIFVGVNGEFVSPHNGILFLSVNEGNLKDNSGSYVARVRVMSTK